MSISRSRTGPYCSIGDLTALPPKKILRISNVFVSHTHMDHFFGFERPLRICLGRNTTMRFYGSPGFLAQVGPNLTAYTWKLEPGRKNAGNFEVYVWEVDLKWQSSGTRLRCHIVFSANRLCHGTSMMACV